MTICDLQSLGVFIAALVIYFKPEWNIIDPVCTFVFSVLVLGTTLRILRDTVNVLMEGGSLVNLITIIVYFDITVFIRYHDYHLLETVYKPFIKPPSIK